MTKKEKTENNLWGWKTGLKDIALLGDLAVMSPKKIETDQGVDVGGSLFRLRERFLRSDAYVKQIKALARKYPHIQKLLLPSKPDGGYEFADDDEE